MTSLSNEYILFFITGTIWFILFGLLAVQDYIHKEIDAVLTIIWFVLSFIIAYIVHNLAPMQTYKLLLFNNNFLAIVILRLISVTLFLLFTLGIIKLRYLPDDIDLFNISQYLGAGDIIIIYGLAIILSFDYFYPLMVLASIIGIIWKLIFKKRRIPFVTMLFIATTIPFILSLLPGH